MLQEQLKWEITRLQNQLYKSNTLKQNRDKETILSKKAQDSFEYISTWGNVSALD